RNFGSDAIGRRGQQRLAIAPLEREQSGEPAQLADHFGSAGLFRQWLEQFDGSISRLDVDAGGGVGGASRTATVAGPFAHWLLIRSVNSLIACKGTGMRSPGVWLTGAMLAGSIAVPATASATAAEGVSAYVLWQRTTDGTDYVFREIT